MLRGEILQILGFKSLAALNAVANPLKRGEGAALGDTVNRKTGRVACVVSDNTARVYSIDALPAPEANTQTTAQAGAEVNAAAELGDFDLDRLDEWRVPDRVKLILQDGHGLEETKEGDSSRSAWLFDAVCNLMRGGVPDQVVFDAICAPNLGIADAVRRERHGSGLRARRNWRKYALHQIENAKKVVAADAQEFVCDQHGKIVSANQRNIRVALHRLPPPVQERGRAQQHVHALPRHREQPVRAVSYRW